MKPAFIFLLVSFLQPAFGTDVSVGCAFNLASSVLSPASPPKYEFDCSEKFGFQILRRPLFEKFVQCRENYSGVRFAISDSRREIYVSYQGHRATISFKEGLYPGRDDYFGKQVLNTQMGKFFETRILSALLSEPAEKILSAVKARENKAEVFYTKKLFRIEGDPLFQMEGARGPFPVSPSSSQSKWVHFVVRVGIHGGTLEVDLYQYSKNPVAKKVRISLLDAFDANGNLRGDFFNWLYDLALDHPSAKSIALPGLSTISILPGFDGYQVLPGGELSR